MKKIIFHSSLLIFILFSCSTKFSFQKRKYTKGYYFSLSKSNKKNIPVQKSKSFISIPEPEIELIEQKNAFHCFKENHYQKSYQEDETVSFEKIKRRINYQLKSESENEIQIFLPKVPIQKANINRKEKPKKTSHPVSVLYYIFGIVIIAGMVFEIMKWLFKGSFWLIIEKLIALAFLAGSIVFFIYAASWAAGEFTGNLLLSVLCLLLSSVWLSALGLKGSSIFFV